MVSALAAVVLSAGPELPPLSLRGKHLIDPSGHAVTLKGANIGNWLIKEMWMLGHYEGAPQDQYEMEEAIERRFGRAERERLMELYRHAWMAPRDWQILQSYGFNLVRLPLNYRLFIDDDAPQTLKADGLRWLDHAISQAARHGMYTIIDMHGVPGGQNSEHHSGRAGQNKVWESAEDQKRLAWLWTQLAARTRSNPNVIAYDAFNEPYGGSKEGQVKLFQVCYDAIRKSDPDKLILAHGNWDDFDHYGDPAEKGWRNTGFQMHYYPGLFGGQPTLITHARHLRSLEGISKRIDRLNVPFLIGEMNVVFDKAGGAAMMRRTFDDHARYGWMTTMWSYKVLTPGGGIGDSHWGMATNAKPYALPNLETASLDEIEEAIRSLGTMELTVNEPLRTAMTGPAPSLALPGLPPARTTAPQGRVAGWTFRDIGASLAGGQEPVAGGFALFGGGADVWGTDDQFRFASRTASGDQVLEAEVASLEDVAEYAKGGLMARAGDARDAARVMITVFPTGEAQFAWRPSAGADTQSAAGVPAEFPVRLRLERQGDEWIGSVRVGGEWKEAGRARASLPQRLDWGVMALSHEPSLLVRAEYRSLSLRPR